MNSPNADIPAARAEGWGAAPTGVAQAPQWHPASPPLWRPEDTPPAQDVQPQEDLSTAQEAEPPLSTGRCVAMLVFGLLPVIGLVLSLVWAYSASSTRGRSNLAKAMLWLHGAVLVAALVLLGLWVLGLALRALGPAGM